MTTRRGFVQQSVLASAALLAPRMVYGCPCW